jgi:hypothetical protein
VAFTWRDPAIIGPFRMEHLQLVLIGVVAAVGFMERRRARVVVAAVTPIDVEARLA